MASVRATQNRESGEARISRSSALATAFGNFFIDGQKANDILANLLKQWAKFAIPAAFTGQGPFASLLGFATPSKLGT